MRPCSASKPGPATWLPTTRSRWPFALGSSYSASWTSSRNRFATSQLLGHRLQASIGGERLPGFGDDSPESRLPPGRDDTEVEVPQECPANFAGCFHVLERL